MAIVARAMLYAFSSDVARSYKTTVMITIHCVAIMQGTSLMNKAFRGSSTESRSTVGCVT